MSTNVGNKIILDISKQNKEFIDQLKGNDILGFSSLSNKEIFMLACALGLNEPTDFKNKDTYLRIAFLQTSDKALLVTTKLGTAKTNDEIDKYCNIEYTYAELERCANTGFEVLRKKVEDANSDDTLLANRMLVDLSILYQRNVK